MTVDQKFGDDTNLNFAILLADFARQARESGRDAIHPVTGQRIHIVAGEKAAQSILGMVHLDPDEYVVIEDKKE